MQDHPKVSYRFWIDTPIPTWPHPWIQVLLTAYGDVDGDPRLFQVMPYVGQDTAGHRFTEFNLQVADARGRTRIGPPAGPRPAPAAGAQDGVARGRRRPGPVGGRRRGAHARRPRPVRWPR